MENSLLSLSSFSDKLSFIHGNMDVLVDFADGAEKSFKVKHFWLFTHSSFDGLGCILQKGFKTLVLHY